ncbi:MAG: hypothetical protein KAI47_14990, partial [Deltaproteobacteria bacterium]|nr:hypothetical protein [Deltaproteobacteria bacterium]
ASRQVLGWVDGFYNRRLLGSIGNIPPAAYEKMHGDPNETQAAVAGLNEPTPRRTRGGSTCVRGPPKSSNGALAMRL